MMVMESKNLLNNELQHLQIYISTLGENAKKESQNWLFNLRKNGFRTDKDYLSRSFKAQMRDANKQRAKIVLILGDNELDNNEFSVKEMETGNQTNASFDKIIEYLKNYFKPENN